MSSGTEQQHLHVIDGNPPVDANVAASDPEINMVTVTPVIEDLERQYPLKTKSRAEMEREWEELVKKKEIAYLREARSPVNKKALLKECTDYLEVLSTLSGRRGIRKEAETAFEDAENLAQAIHVVVRARESTQAPSSPRSEASAPSLSPVSSPTSSSPRSPLTLSGLAIDTNIARMLVNVSSTSQTTNQNTDTDTSQPPSSSKLDADDSLCQVPPN